MRTLILAVNFLVLSTIASAAAVDCSLAAPTGAIGANVNSLGMGCFGGGLLFDSFSVNSAPAGTSVFVSAIGTGAVAGPQGFSLGFQITTPTPPVDTILDYRVSSLTGAATIIGVDLAHNGNNTTIGEVVCDQAFFGGTCATGHVLANFSNPPTPNGAVVSFAAQTSIFIQKDISQPGNNSFISSFVNSHETGGAIGNGAVPEPSTALLFGFGLCGLAGFARKLRKA